MFGLDNDEDLIGKALQGAPRAWDRLVRRYEKPVYNMAYRMTGNRQDALDLMQEAFLAVYRHLPSYRSEGAFGGWLLRIVSNRGVDFIRRNRQNPLRGAAEVDEEQVCGNSRVDADAEQSQLQKTLWQQMQRLSPEQRQMVELKFFQHLTFEEIAERIGIPENTAKTRLYTALRVLRGSEALQHAL